MSEQATGFVDARPSAGGGRPRSGPGSNGEPADACLRLPDGRQLGYRIYGVPGGKPVYFFHGFPGSRIQAALVHGQAVAGGIALVAFDRPGFGLSDRAPAPRVEHIARDVLALSDALQHRRFALLGVSCGGPHALATAQRAPDRVAAVGLLAGIGPMNRPELQAAQLPLLRTMFRLARRWPPLVGPLLALDWAMFRGSAERAVKVLSSMLTAPDRQALEGSAALRTAFGASLADAYRQGIGGALQEAVRIAHVDESLLDGLRVPVHVFQSGHDRHVPPAMGRFMAQRLAHGVYHDCPDEGHLSIVTNRFDECVRAVTRDL